MAWGLERPALGISLGGTHGPDQAERHRAWTERAERLGLHSLWLPEMHFQPGVCPAPLIELAGFAARTERLRLGTTSLLLPLLSAVLLRVSTRHTLSAVRSAATSEYTTHSVSYRECCRRCCFRCCPQCCYE